MTVGERIITVFGTGKAGPGDEVFQLAYEVGNVLARRGFVVANGGYGGTMSAAAKGARQVGGEVVGVTCTAFGRGGANEYVTKEILTESLDERLEKLVELGDAYVVLAGGTGTLLELAYVWEFKNKGFLSADRPIIIVGRFWKSLLELIDTMDPDSSRCLEVVPGATEVVEILAGRANES
ncbi:MAG TPA: LOG family protein [Planctomycetes bacterium]|nr:LOG family protein [Planctomycetota bacterium]HIJ69991.1 LOG family protein [Planctomycetota bacterium]